MFVGDFRVRRPRLDTRKMRLQSRVKLWKLFGSKLVTVISNSPGLPYGANIGTDGTDKVSYGESKSWRHSYNPGSIIVALLSPGSKVNRRFPEKCCSLLKI